MKNLRRLLVFIFFLLSFDSIAGQILVKNLADVGTGSLRWAYSQAVPGDTIYVNVRGVIQLETPITINNTNNITLIGPQARHLAIVASPTWSAGPATSLFLISNSNGITIEHLAFKNGFIGVRAIEIVAPAGTAADPIKINHCLFEGINNSGFVGGAISSSGNLVDIVNCSFVSNTADIGGAIYLISDGLTRVVNCTFWGNQGTFNGGAMFIQNTGTIEVRHNTFFENNSVNDLGEVMWVSNGPSVIMHNNAGAGNSTSDQFMQTSPGSIVSSGGNVIKLNGGAEIFPGTVGADFVNISVNPGLDPVLEDGFGLKYFTAADNGSHFVDAGTVGALPPSDCRNAPRTLYGGINFGRPDAGASEFTLLRVTTTGGGNTAGSLLNAVSQNYDPINFVEFRIPGAGPHIIGPTSTVILDDGYIVDGYTQPLSEVPGPAAEFIDGVTEPQLKIEVTNMAGLTIGFMANSVGTTGTVVQGLRIGGFDESGIRAEQPSMRVFGCEIGINEDISTNANGQTGIYVNADNVEIGGVFHWQRNTISGNGVGGGFSSNLYIDSGVLNTKVSGNIIGIDPTGMSAIIGVNGLYGIFDFQATSTHIGSPAFVGGNTIGMHQSGIIGFDNSNLDVFNNKIGMAYNGLDLMPNNSYGIELDGTGAGISAQIGKPGLASRNIISGNTVANISIANYTEIAIENNYIGPDSTGASAPTTTNTGVLVNHPDAGSVFIGNSNPGSGNVISGNGDGININASGGNTTILQNYIGTRSSGIDFLSNTSSGISVQSGASTCFIGSPGFGNVISGNGAATYGIFFNQASGHFVESNRIGIGANDLAQLENGHGIFINVSTNISIGGGIWPNEGNIIGTNDQNGITVINSSVITIMGNLMGVNAGGTGWYANGSRGIHVEGSDDVVIGGAGDLGNVINSHSGGGDAAIHLEGSGNTTIIGNKIGVDVAGTTSLPNNIGIEVFNPHNAIIGNPGIENYICGSIIAGLHILSPNVIMDGNYVGVGVGNIANVQLSNEVGALIQAETVVIGATAGSINVFANNNTHGIHLAGDVTDDCRINFCNVGVDGVGFPAPNGQHGIYIQEGDFNLIGDIGANLVQANTQAGIYIEGNAQFNEIMRSLIGNNIADNTLANDQGVVITTGATNNTIGGVIPGSGNQISGNLNEGIFLSAASSTTIIQNLIGIDPANLPSPNLIGIHVFNSINVTIGGENSNGNGTHNVISNNTFEGIIIDNSDNADIYGNRIGMDVAGNNAAPNLDGILIENGSTGTSIGNINYPLHGNTISGNTNSGIIIDNCSANNIQQNYIGTTLNGLVALNFQDIGILLTSGASANVIGGNKFTQGNQIAGNVTAGIMLQDADNNFIQGNAIGLHPFSNQLYGVILDGALCHTNDIGTGPYSSFGNVISENATSGILIDNGAYDNIIQSNIIGLDTFNTISGTTIQVHGVETTPYAGANNKIGHDALYGRNVISGNSIGVMIDSSENQLVFNNYIGTDTTGTMALGNTFDGVLITNGAANNTVGGSNTFQPNLISGNVVAGVHIEGAGTQFNYVEGNNIGFSFDGSNPIPNQIGVGIDSGPTDNYVGTSGPGNGNVIGGNTLAGISIYAANSNQVANNEIGVIHANNIGIQIENGSQNNIIGGLPADGNIISGNDSIGLTLINADLNFISSNTIGLLADGQTPWSNLIGVLLSASNDNQIGSPNSGEHNTISGNTFIGIAIEDSSNNNDVENNYLGTGATGNAVFGGTSNGNGIYIFNSDGNTIGGDLLANEGNVICFNAQNGIWLDSATNTTITGNNIGIAKNNGNYLGNGLDGIYIANGSTQNTVGNPTSGFRNNISDNLQSGVHIKNSFDNTVQNNFIGNDHMGGLGTIAGINDQANGVYLDTGAFNNGIIGSNVISGNLNIGVILAGPNTDSNYVSGNKIGVDVAGNNSYPNGIANVYFIDGAKENLVGGSTVPERNYIGGDVDYMVVIDGMGTDSNKVAGNYIGLGFDQATTYNSQVGIIVQNNAKRNTIGGGNNPNEGNTIVEFDLHGIYISTAQNTAILGNRIGIMPDNSPGTIDSAGVFLANGDATWIGAYLPGSDSINIITNCNTGVAIDDLPILFGNTYSSVVGGNSIYNNVAQGIDINNDEMVLPIDTNNSMGALNNGEIDRPEIVSAWNCGVNGYTQIGFKYYASNTLNNYHIEFYRNPTPDLSGFGEGEIYLGDYIFTAGTPYDTIVIDLGFTLPVGTVITATMTGVLGNTSEFSEQDTVTAPPNLGPMSTMDETCLGAANGLITLTANDAYQFSLDGGLTWTPGNGIYTAMDSAGTYTITSQYLNGCTQDIMAILNPGPALPFGYTIIPDTCAMGVGSIVIDTTNTDTGGGTGDYIYTFNGGSAYLGSIDTLLLNTGSFSIGLFDTTAGCYSNIDPIIVPEINDVIDESFTFDSFCPGASAVPTNIITGGGTWEINPAATDGTIINSSTGELTNTTVGNSYTIIYTVGVCLEKDTNSVLAAAIDDPTFSYSNFCVGTNPTISTSTAGGTWTLVSGTGTIDSLTGILTAPPGNYNVAYTTNGTCPDSDTALISLFLMPAAPPITSAQTVYCPNDALQLISTSPDANLTFNWFSDPALTNNVGSGDSFTPTSLATGDNYFYLTSLDTNNCGSAADSINFYQVDVSGMYADPDQDVCFGSKLTLEAYGGVTYLWDLSNQILDDLTLSNPLSSITIAEDFIVTITDTNGCVVADTISIGLLPQDQCYVDVYNTFSPNNDGVNDFWIIDGIEGFPENTVFVYNRWGDVIVKFINYDNSSVVWDGSNKNNKVVPMGTYFYVVEVGGQQNQANWVQVMK